MLLQNNRESLSRNTLKPINLCLKLALTGIGYLIGVPFGGHPILKSSLPEPDHLKVFKEGAEVEKMFFCCILIL